MGAAHFRDRPVRMTPLQKVLSEAIRSSSMTYTQMSVATGMRRSTISEMINGRVNGSIMSWQKLLDATNVQIGWKR